MKKYFPVLFVVSFLLFATSAFAYTIADNYEGSDGHGYGDVIGSVDQYGIDGINVSFSEKYMTVDIYTGFTESNDSYNTKYGDLFISTNGWSPYGSEPGYTSDDSTNGEDWELVFDTSEGKLYSGFDYLLSTEADPYIQGGFIVRDGQEVLRKDGTGTALSDNSFVDMTYLGDYITYNISLSSLSGATDIGLKWGMTCANDTIEGAVTAPVPEPATMVLLGSGLIGLTLYRRKIKK